MTSISAAAQSSKLFAGIGAIVVLLALAACGGGGGSTPTQQHLHGNSYRPCAVGLSNVSAGNALTIISRPLPPPSPAPPSPQPSVTIPATVQISTSILTNGANFGSQSGLTQLHSVEQYKTALQTTAVQTDTFVACPASNAGNYSAAGWTSIDSNGVSLTLTYGPGNGLVDILPEMSGAAWTNNAALTLSEIDADGQTSNRAVNADGSYTEKVRFPDGTASTAIEKSDGTGSYSIPFGGPNAGPNDVINIGTPNPLASGGPAIPIVIVVPSASPQSLSVPDWYPPGPLVLASETDQNMGAATIPPSCNVAAAIGSSGNKIIRTSTRFDTIFGEIERDSATTYTVAGLGIVCSVISNQLSAYYDYTAQGVNFSGVPQQLTSFTETVGAQSVSVPQAATSQAQIIALRVNVAQQRFWRIVRARHASQLRGLRTLRLRGRQS